MKVLAQRSAIFVVLEILQNKEVFYHIIFYLTVRILSLFYNSLFIKY